ncbi:MAG TPA: glycosyltransferase family 4 protein [Gemmatimonadales bacterium]|nr:glycosyltransferase family 4 protein [Gemmatimonadales bacterium]
MVVVFVTHNYPRHAGDLAGAFLHPLALALSGRGHDVRVVAPADRGNGGREPLDGIPVRRVRYSAAGRETLAYEGRMQEAVRTPGGLLALLRLINALRRGALAEVAEAATDRPTARPPVRPAVVHAHWWFPAGLALPSGVPSLVTLHGTDARLLTQSAAARWLGRRVLRRTSVVTAVSPELAAVAEGVSGRGDVASHVQAMPVDSTVGAASGGGGGIFVVGRLSRQKRTELAIRAAAELAQQGTPLPLTVIGDGVERGALERLAATLPSPASVRFAGALPAAEVARRLGEADVLLFPAQQEGLGLAAIEALIAGVPVVACSDGGGVVSALRRHGGGIITEPTPAALAGAMLDARSPERRAEARHAGERWRAELAPDRVAEVFEGWYREALGA